MLKLSSTLEMAAANVAKKMLDKDIQEDSIIPEMPSFLISRTKTCPSDHVSLGEIKVGDVDFYLFQMF